MYIHHMHISIIRNNCQIFQVLRKLLFVKIWAWIRLEYKKTGTGAGLEIKGYFLG